MEGPRAVAEAAEVIPSRVRSGAAQVAPSRTALEQWHIYLVNAEYQRSKKGKWRRLFPSERSADYFQFFDPSHKLHFLPYGV